MLGVPLGLPLPLLPAILHRTLRKLKADNGNVDGAARHARRSANADVQHVIGHHRGKASGRHGAGAHDVGSGVGGQGRISDHGGTSTACPAANAQGGAAVVAAGVVGVDSGDDVVLAGDVDRRRVGGCGVGLDGLGKAEDLLRVDDGHCWFLLG